MHSKAPTPVTTGLLQELAEIHAVGAAFYQDAAQKLAHVHQAGACQTLARAHTQVFEALEPILAASSVAPLRYDGTLLSAMRRLYAEGRENLYTRPAALPLSLFADLEDLALEYNEIAAHAAPSHAARETLRCHLPALSAAHQQLYGPLRAAA